MVPGYSGGTAPAFHRLPFSFVEDEHPVSFVEGYYTDEKRTCKRLRKKNPLSPWADLNPKVSWGCHPRASGDPGHWGAGILPVRFLPRRSEEVGRGMN